MGVVIESSVWEPSPSVFVFFFVSVLLSVFLFPYYSKSRTFGSFDHAASSSFTRFQRWFLFIYSFASVMEGLWSVYGESEMTSNGLSKEPMMTSLCVGFAAALIFGPFLGLISDLVGQKKACLLFCILHLFVGIWKRISTSPSLWTTNVFLSLSATIFSFSFETWMVVEHEKQGQRKDSLNDAFWLMTFLESASLIGSQVLGNSLGGDSVKHGVASSSTVSLVVAAVAIFSLTRTGKGSPKSLALKDYTLAFCAYIIGDKRILLLGLSQACLQFAIAVFWLLWAPTVVADGREVHLGLIYPCLLSARMLGSTVFQWVTGAQSFLRTEDCLVYAYSTMGIVLSIIAYDYQEIGVLVTLFCLFHACAGLTLPLLSSLRTLYVPNELRGGMIGFFTAPANAALLFCLIQRGYYQKLENSTMMAIGSVALFAAAGCMYLLRRWGKAPHQDWHKL